MNEFYFVFACIWAFRSSLYHDGTIDHRAEFSKYFRSEFKNVTFPKNGNVFDFYVNNTVSYLFTLYLYYFSYPFQELYEFYFVFACIWAFGSSLYHDGTIDHRAEFSKWFGSEFKNVTFPNNGNVFDFYVDNTVIDKQSMMPWVNRVPKFELDPDVPLQAVLVHTPETIRIKYFLDMLVNR